jgi:hypothetical protein
VPGVRLAVRVRSASGKSPGECGFRRGESQRVDGRLLRLGLRRERAQRETSPRLTAIIGAVSLLAVFRGVIDRDGGRGRAV